MLAPAPRDRPGHRDLRLDRPEARALVRPVAERLAFGTPARAPPIRARLSLLHNGSFLKDDCFAHNLGEEVYPDILEMQRRENALAECARPRAQQCWKGMELH